MSAKLSGAQNVLSTRESASVNASATFLTERTKALFMKYVFFSGGQNAFNYVSLVMAILTLIVNVNNNINNNNNNLNQFSGNVVGNNNANANTNNLNGNIVNVMPPGKRRKRSLNNSLKYYQNDTLTYHQNNTLIGDQCLKNQDNFLSDASLAAIKLIEVSF